MSTNWNDFEPVDKPPAAPRAGKVDWSQFEPVKPDDTGDVARGFKESFQQLPQLGYGLLAGAGAIAEKAVGEGGIATGIKTAGVKGYVDWGDKIAAGSKESDSWNYSYDQAKQGNFGALVDWLQHGLGYVTGQGVQALATAGIGAVGGKFVASTAARQIAEGMVAKEAATIAAANGGRLTAEQVAKQATENVAAKFATVGQSAALGAAGVGQEGGEIFGDLASEAAKDGHTLTGTDLGKAFISTLVAGGLEFVGDKVGLDIALGKSRLLKPAEGMLGLRGRAARGGIAAAGAAPIEAGTEFGQTLVEEYGKGNDPTSAASMAQARDAAALGALGGTAIGGAGGAVRGAKASAAEPEGPPGLLSYSPDPLISFPDGTVGKRADVERYVDSLPEDQRAAMRARLMGLAPQVDPVTTILQADSIDDAIDAARKAVGYRVGIPAGEATEFPTVPAGEATALDTLPPGLRFDLPRTGPDELPPAPLPVGEVSAPIPTGDATELPARIPVGRATELAADVVEPQAPAQADAGLTPRRRTDATPIDLRSGAASVAAFVKRMSETNTPAARAFVQEYRAGRIKDDEVLQLMLPRKPEPSADERLAAAAAVRPTDLVTKDGMPYGSKIAAAVRARKEGGNVIEIPGAGWVVRQERAEPAAGEATDVQPTADATERAPLTGRLATIEGDKIDNEWSAFTPESGTKGIPRAEMPQIKAEHRGAMVNFLAARGITHETSEVPAGDLKPTQAEFSPAKVEKAKAYEGGDRSILVSADGHVLDGHHQWMAKRDAGGPVKVIRLNAPIDKLLSEVKEFPSVETAEGATAPEPVAAGIVEVPPAKPRVYRLRSNAEREKTGNTQRIQKVKGGYILREASDKEMAAAERAGRRLARGTGVDVENDSLLTAIAKLGGVAIKERADTIGQGNRNIGGRMLFRIGGKSIDALANEDLRELGYVPAGEHERDGGVRWLRDAIRSEFDGSNTFHSEQGTEWMEEQQRAREGPDDFEEALADFTPDELDEAGYLGADPAVQAATEQLLREAESAGIDTEALQEDSAKTTEGKTADEYHADLQEAARQAIAEARQAAGRPDAGPARGSDEDRGQPAGDQGEESGDEGLTSPTSDGLRAADERDRAADAADRREQQRLVDKAQADAERDEFILTGSDRPADIAAAAGQRDIFGGDDAQPEAAEGIADVGEKIGGARKDRWKDRGLDVSDLDAMSEAEGATLANKANVWKPDFAAMVAAGTPAKHAALVKIVYDRLAAQPRSNTPEGRRNYVTAMQAVRAAYGSLDGTSPARRASEEARSTLHRALGVDSKEPTERAAAKKVLFAVYKGRSDPFVVFYDEERKADKMVADGFPEKVEPWKRRLALRDAGGLGTTDAGVKIYRESADGLGTPLTDAQIRGGFVAVRTKDGKTLAMLPTRDDAEAAAKRLYEAMLSRDATEDPERPHLDLLQRTGLPTTLDRDVTAEDFRSHFGFRGVEFGNWSAQDERQKLLNLAYDGLSDLASIMGVPPKAMSLNGTLGMAFGARGGGRFAAHYEPGKLVINMTKIRGGGSLAHEWAHAFDHYLGELARDDAYQTSARGASGWMQRMVYERAQQKRLAYEPGTRKLISTATPRLTNLRPEMAEAIDAVMQTMFGPDGKPTSYLGEAQKLSGKSTEGYWTRPTEMFARAFESYTFDRLLAMGAKSEYLVHGVEPDRFAATDRYKGNPYPVGAERASINAAFDKLIAEIKTREDEAGNVAMFRRRGGARSVESVQQIVDAIAATWADAPRIVVVANAEDPAVPQAIRDKDAEMREQGGSGTPTGVFYKNTVYVFADSAASPLDVARTLYHEVLGHYGFRGAFGDALQPMLEQMVRLNRAAVAQKAEDYGFDMNDEAQRRRAAEEVLAELAETRPSSIWVRRAVAAIRTWLRENVSYFKDLELSNDEIIRTFIAPARGFVERGGRAESMDEQPAFSLAPEEGGIIRVSQIQMGDGPNWVVSRNLVNGQQHLGYFKSEADAREAAEREQTEAKRSAGAGARWWVANPAEPVQSASLGRLDSLGRARALKTTLDARSDSIQSREQGVDLEQIPDRAGFCFKLAAEASAAGLGDMVIGIAENDGNPVWHAVVMRDSAVYDPTFGRWFEPGVYEALGFRSNTTLTSKAVRDYIAASGGFAPDARRLKLVDDGMPMFRRTLSERIKGAGGGAKIIGATGRKYTSTQREAMRNVGFEVEEPTLEQRARALWQDAGKKLAQGLVDQFAPVKDLSQEAYGLLRLAKGASGAFETLLQGGRLKLTEGVYDFDQDARGGVVETLLKPLQGEHHDFFRWVAANRAERLRGEGKEHLFSEDDVAALKTLADGRTDFDYTMQHGARAGQTTRDRSLIYADALKTFNEFNKNVLDMAEQSGLIDGESRSLWEHEFYVPFYRVAEEETGGVRGMNIKGGSVRQQAFKALKGGKQALNADLLDNTLMNWAHLLDAAAKNRAAKATLDAAESMGMAASAPEATAREMMNSVGKKSNVVWVMDGGQKHFYAVEDPYLMTALTSLEYAGMRSPLMNAMGSFKRALTIGVTASPFFKVRNLIRDSVQAIGTAPLGANPFANVAQGWKLTDPKSDAYFRLLAGGGTIHFGTMLEGSEAKRVQSLVESGVDRASILDDGKRLKAFYRKFIEPSITAYNELGNRGEAVNRASLYAQLRKQGIGHAQASLQARDLMDFSMQGSFTSIRFLSQVVPFLNARIQGLYKLGRAAKEDPQRFSAVIGAATLASLSLLMAFSDDEDWKKREDWDRNNFWWFKFGGTAFRIPKPFEIGAIATLAERAFELAFDKEMTGKRFRHNVLDLLGDNLSMNPVPQLVKPILDVYANKDSFTGRAIESTGMERLKAAYRFKAGTSMAARAISTAANEAAGLIGAETLSPLQVDHLLRGYFGWLGSFVVGAGDVLARPLAGEPGRPDSDIWKAATGGMVSDLRDAPSRYVSQMYQQATEIEKAYATWRDLLKQGKVDDAAEFFAENRGDIVRHKIATRLKDAEGKINQQVQAVERSDMSGSDKRALIRDLLARKDRIARPLAAVD